LHPLPPQETKNAKKTKPQHTAVHKQTTTTNFDPISTQISSFSSPATKWKIKKQGFCLGEKMNGRCRKKKAGKNKRQEKRRKKRSASVAREKKKKKEKKKQGQTIKKHTEPQPCTTMIAASSIPLPPLLFTNMTA